MPVSAVVNADISGGYIRTGLRIQSMTRAIADNFLVAAEMPTLLIFDAGAGNKDVLMPNVATPSSKDLVFFLRNGGAANNLVVKTHDEGATIVTLAPGEGLMLHCNGVVWDAMTFDPA